ncbi:histone-lysine N-methyltransferase SETD2 isoform X2 [Anabrus simplex]|uniref:histone-lysine N-methyltransferase SETD2 isoform X2 n=1 Tax=Anabrus simplex TaxID=316456 RepID=UPI0035A316FD
MVIAVIYVMARRRKGAAGSKAAAAAKARAARNKANGVLDDRPNGTLKMSPATAEESSVKTPIDNPQPLSCRTPMEVCPADPSHGEPPPVILPTPQHLPVVHKKFGKFRCLLETEPPQPGFQQNCTAVAEEEEKIAEVVTDAQPPEEVVIEQVDDGSAAEVMIEHEVGESEEVMWEEEEVIEETVVCEGMEIELEDSRSQGGSRAVEGDSRQSEYCHIIEVKDNGYGSQDEQVVAVREGEFQSREIVEVANIPQITEAVSQNMVLKDVCINNEQDLRKNEEFEMVEQEVVTVKNVEFDSDSSILRVVDEYSQESQVSVRGVEMEVESEHTGEVEKCVSYGGTSSVGTGEFERNDKCDLVKNSEENCREIGDKILLKVADTVTIENDKLSGTKTSYYDCETSVLRNKTNVDCSELGIQSEMRISAERTVEEDTGSDHHEIVKGSGDDDGETKPLPASFRSRSGSTDTTGSESGSSCSVGVRRSSRLRSIGVMKQRSREKSDPSTDSSEGCELTVVVDNGLPECSISAETPSDLASKIPVPLSSPATTAAGPVIPAVPSYEMSVVDMSKPVKVKSRWRRSSELEMGGNRSSDSELAVTPPTPSISPRPVQLNTYSLSPKPVPLATSVNTSVRTMALPALGPPEMLSQEIGEDMPLAEALLQKETPRNEKKEDEEMVEKLRNFVHLTENEYLTERSTSKEAKRMVCDCFLTKEEWNRGDMGCGEDCLNRLLMIECGSRCAMGDRCSNKRFQKQEYSKCEIFKTEKKGFGLKALCDLPIGAFIMEYVGEVLDPKEFRRRAKDYSKEKNRHYYFMALKSDSIIDATMKGNASRFINHSCDPNSETQKWTVNGELRIGFFSKRPIIAGEEVTFDYQLQRYGKEAQRCHCEAPNCRGWIGEDPEKEKRERKERKEREIKKKKEEKRKDVKEFLDDMDLEEEIEKLGASGLKNRTHTLTLCRLMVRAEERESRVQLLKLIQGGETACRRLFLDYHGLRLIWSWMMDVGCENSEEELELRTEILQTLAKLPIPNKTMLQDSKVMAMVEKWLLLMTNSECGESTTAEPSQDSIKKESQPLDEESRGSDVDIKPRIDAVLPGGMEVPDEETCQGLESEKQLVDGTPELTARELGLRRSSESDDEGGDGTLSLDKHQVFIKLASRLIHEWSSLKEVFRIPKKERIEQMKEHEREADRGYKEYLDKEGNHDKQSYDRNLVAVPRMSKHERRHLFALKVAQEEQEERHRRQQQEMWRHHEGQCLALGMDPTLTAAIDPQTGYPCFFDPASGTWQSYPPQDPNTMPAQEIGPSPVFNPNNPHSPHLPVMPGAQHGLPPHGIPPHPPGPHYGPPLPHGPSPHGPPLPHGPGQQGPPLPHGSGPQGPSLPHGPSLQGPPPLPQGPPLPHGPSSQGLLPLPQGPPIPHGPVAQGPSPLPHGPSPHGPPLPLGASPLGPPVPHGPPHPHGTSPHGPPHPHGPPPHPHRASPHAPSLPHGLQHPNRTSPHGPPLSHGPSLLGPCPPHLLPSHGPPLPHRHPPQGTPPPHGPPLPHGIPPQGPPLPHGIPPQGPPLPHGMPPQGPPLPHGIPPQGPPLPNGIPPHGPSHPHEVPPYAMPPQGISPHHVIPTHGAPPLSTHGIPPHSVQAPMPGGNYDPNQSVPYDPNHNAPTIQQQHPRPGPLDPNTPESIPLPVGPQPPFQQPPAQQVYTPQPGSAEPQTVPQPQYHQVHPVQHPYMQPVPLPPKWKSAKDSEGRVYYYHVKTRISQWEPPQWNQVDQQPESETSSESSEDDDDEDEEESSTTEEEDEAEQEDKAEEDEEEDEEEEAPEDKDNLEEEEMVLVNPDDTSSLDPIEETDSMLEVVGPSRSLVEDPIKRERKREGLVQERIISPRRDDDQTENNNNNKRYKEIKEKLRRKKEQKRAQERSEKAKKRHRDGKPRSEKPVTVAADTSSDAASRKIKDQFRLQMAGFIVQVLNAYRKPDCKVGHIKSTDDFKHLARKLTHFVMLKELKHCRNVIDLECNENVKHKAKDFVKKYMAKFGPVYTRPKEDV